MTVYGEILFLENAVSGAVILLLTGKLRGCSPGKWKIVLGAAMCGAYAFILFAEINWSLAMLSKLLFSLAVVQMVYRPVTYVAAVKATIVFYIVSFLTGGITIAIMYMFKIPGITANGSIYLQEITSLQVAAGLIVSYILGSWLADLLREKAQKEAVIKEVTIHIGVHSWIARALVDTGNSLREPVTGYPVAVVSERLGAKIKEKLAEERICVIPYKSVGGKGLLYGVRPDYIEVTGEPAANVILGISEGNFSPWEGSEEYEILLHQQLFKGGDNDDQKYSGKVESVGAVERVDQEILLH